MPVLKDMRCIRCDSVQEQPMPCGLSRAKFVCPVCQRKTQHQSLCTGGVRKHLVFNSHDLLHHPEYFVAVEGIKAGYPGEHVGTQHESSRATPATMARTGEVIHAMARFSKEARQEKREKRVFEQLKKRGRQPITMSWR